MFTVRALWQHTTRQSTLPPLGCDGKMVKSMVLSFYLTDRDILAVADLDVLRKVCAVLGILPTTTTTTSSMPIIHHVTVNMVSSTNSSLSTSSSSSSSSSTSSSTIVQQSLSATLEKLETMRGNSLRDQKPAIERTAARFEAIVQSCIESAMKITRTVVEQQNQERRILMNQMRSNDESGLAHEWKRLIRRMCHEGAPWHCPRLYPRSWKLDATEGPARCRVRLRRCHLRIDRKFLMPDLQPRPSADDEPLAYLKSSLVQRPHFALSDQVLYTFACHHLPIDNEVAGEMIITESQLIFLANDLWRAPIQLDIKRITDIWLRRYQHRETGLEFCLDIPSSVFFYFAEPTDREVLVRYFADKIVQCPAATATDDGRLARLTQHWRDGQLTNWEYLMALNQISGRTFQDLMQYPVFPWVLADYKSATLCLRDSRVYRALGVPIAVQHKENETHYITNYNVSRAFIESFHLTNNISFRLIVFETSAN